MDRAAVAEDAERILNFFESKGAIRVEVDILQPAAKLLDIYGEDIRTRAYMTFDAAGNEMVLRPDFTVPVAGHHMANGMGRTRYTYFGSVFRKQEPGSDKPSEYLQTGFEQFGDEDRTRADAEVFMVFHELLGTNGIRVSTGDLGVLLAAVEGLGLSERRKQELLRQLWRPSHFRQALDRLSKATKLSRHKRKLIELEAEGSDLLGKIHEAGPEIGTRTAEEVVERIKALSEDSADRPLSASAVHHFRTLLALKAPMAGIPRLLRDLANYIPGLGKAARAVEDRMDALSDLGYDPANLSFAARYGRTTLEYYDGFVFGWHSDEDGAPVASGGRYDRINEILGSGQKCTAIGGVVRPAELARIRG